jgi:hypothetical protein
MAARGAASSAGWATRRIRGTGRFLLVRFLDGLVKSPISALRFISRHCGVRQVFLIPRDSQALISNILRNRLIDYFLRVRLFFAVKENEHI